MRKIFLYTLAFTALVTTGCWSESSTTNEDNGSATTTPEPTLVYNIVADDYELITDTVRSGESMGKILNRFGVSALTIDKLDKASKDIFRWETFVPTVHIQLLLPPTR